MQKKVTVSQLKANLAMAAFVLIAVLMLASTSAGVVGYVAFAVGAQPASAQTNAQPAAFSLANPSTVQSR